MNTFKKITSIALTSALALAGIMMINTPALAQNTTNSHMSVTITNSGNAHIKGTVTAVTSSTISVSSWGGTWVVNTQGATIPGGLAQIIVGDTVMVNGAVTTGMNIQAKTITDKTKPQNTNDAMKKISGTISNFNATAGTFTLTNSTGNINITTNASTTVHIGGNTSTVANLSNGITATVAGTFTQSTNTLLATTIKSPAHPVVFENNLQGKFKGIFKLFNKLGWTN